ncbi:protein KINESIN LIGHT CHAIN-RELATED 2-like [Phragmites australis]|uniref:protein KINESIN LIGHT CHAIN-RELATED 2-like n=1 Tax=Phragmites australis TaxID=29695 RepID=UPI002D779B7A|nr:protein KINESIN LIGHT CHAIN-RELATED 2-like [Phragmites australis]
MALRRAASLLLRHRLRAPVPTPTRKTLSPFPPPPRRHFSSRPPPPVPASAAAIADAAEEVFEAARTTNDMLAAFSRLEAAVPASDKRLALACLKLGQHLEASGSADPSRVLSLALRCLNILEASPNASASDAVSLAMALHLAGSASFDLSRFHDSLSFLSRSLRFVSPLLPDKAAAFGEVSEGFDVRPVAHAVRLQLANVKTALGRREEALADMRACLDLKESILPPGSRELGAAYRDLAEAHAAVLDFKQALPLCQKALELHESTLGKNSVEGAHDRRLLGVIYTGLEQHEQALEQNEMSQKVMKSWGLAGPELLHAEIDAANIKIALGQFDEAVRVLKNVAKQVEKDSEIRALVFISMAKALANQEKAGDTKRCLQIACDILEKKELAAPDNVAEAYIEVSSLYEMVNEFDKAISLLKRSLGMLERIPQAQHMEGNVAARIGWLLLLTGKVSEAVPYLEDAVERMKDSFGPKHYGVGYVYNNLGAAYMEMDRPQSAAQMFALAKEVMDVSLGPHHSDTIEACQSLANAYNAMGSYALAMEFQKRVVDSWRSHGPDARDELKEAIRLYNQIKTKALASLSPEDSANALPEPQEQETDSDSAKAVQH